MEPPPVSKWPESFSLSYNFSLPYTREFQSSELVYDVIVHRDADRRLAKQVREEERRKKERASRLVKRTEKTVNRYFFFDTGRSRRPLDNLKKKTFLPLPPNPTSPSTPAPTSSWPLRRPTTSPRRASTRSAAPPTRPMTSRPSSSTHLCSPT